MIQISISEVILCGLFFLLLLVLLVAFIFVTYSMKDLSFRIEEMTKFSHISLVASMYALVGVKSIKESGIIQKIVEKHHILNAAQIKAQEELMTQADIEFDSYLNPMQYQPSRHDPEEKDRFKVEETYSPKTGLDPEDLV